MAIDQWLLEQHRQGLQPPSLRFYTWSPAAISLGYHQKRYPSRWARLTWQGQLLEQVRRPTGGRAVLHQGDLTYALVTSGLSGSRMAIYRCLCQFLIDGWQSLGVTLQFGTAGRSYAHTSSCFSTATAADLITPEGYKLIGSAQLYRAGCVLQHGSIRLRPDPQLYEQVFAARLPPRPVSCDRPAADVVAALVQAARSLGIQFTYQPLSPGEIELAQRRSALD
ncbi:MAG: lipoate--protein ligase family protein [Leptolyngbya sp. SIO4C1]|nr:lipoate--protein ligase family protein [Leptolyngbya sp. SIO4C1]